MAGDVRPIARNREIDPTKGASRREGLDDRHAQNLVRHPLMCVPRDHGVNRPARQFRDDLADLGGLFARRQVGWIVEARTPPAGVRRHDDDSCAAGTEPSGLVGDGRIERRDRQADRVARDRGLQRAARRDTNDADVDAGRMHQHGRLHIRPPDRFNGLDLDEVRGQERKPRLRGTRLEGTARIVGFHLRSSSRTHRTEIELVVANRDGGVADRVVRVDDRGAFVEVRFERALKHVARVDDQNSAAVARTGRAKVVDEAAERRQPAASVARRHRAVKVVGPDDRQGHRGGWGRSSRLLTAWPGHAERDERQDERQDTAPATDHCDASTAHSRMPAENSGCNVTSSRRADVTTGLKVTRFGASLRTPVLGARLHWCPPTGGLVEQPP